MTLLPIGVDVAPALSLARSFASGESIDEHGDDRMRAESLQLSGKARGPKGWNVVVGAFHRCRQFYDSFIYLAFVPHPTSLLSRSVLLALKFVVQIFACAHVAAAGIAAPFSRLPAEPGWSA